MNYGVGLFSVLVLSAVWDCFTYQVCNYLWNCVKGKFENGLKIQCITHTKINWDKPVFSLSYISCPFRAILRESNEHY